MKGFTHQYKFQRYFREFNDLNASLHIFETSIFCPNALNRKVITYYDKINLN